MRGKVKNMSRVPGSGVTFQDSDVEICGKLACVLCSNGKEEQRLTIINASSIKVVSSQFVMSDVV